MFVLKKILNSGRNVPEYCRVATTAGVSYQVGSALTINNGKLINATATDMPKYIAAESAAADEKTTLLCYPVYSNMIFEVPMGISGISTVNTGDKVVLYLSDGYAIKVGTNKTDGVATVVDKNGAQFVGDKVYVKFEN